MLKPNRKTYRSHPKRTPYGNRRPQGNSNGNSAAGDKAYELPRLEELFDGSKPKFSKKYDKYISAVQVPHPIEDPKAYYDEAADLKVAAEYYSDIEGLSGEDKMAALRDLVTDTHRPHPKGYHHAIAQSLYTKIDRRPDGTVRSLYNKEPINFEQYPNISLAQLSTNELSAIAGAMGSAPEVVASWLAFQKGDAELNCEHVVPQSYFGKAEPMKSDFHHLYACDIKDNSRRGSTPYGKFKPEGGRGEAARATLYFMLRYPNVRTPYKSRHIEMLKQWSADDPPQIHEKHRNKEIQKLQGNRNPFIDHPEWVNDFNPR